MAIRRLACAVAAAALLASVLAATPATAAPVRYEAENATISQGAVESNWAGFSGTGFVNYNNVTGSYVEWTIAGAAAGASALAIRFANGTTTNRPMNITVNGALVATPSFAGTGAWNTWATTTVAVTLVDGTNTIRATATTANGGPNVDYAALDAPAPPGTDWSREMVRSTMTRSTPATVGGWSYPVGLYLYGQYQVYLRTGDPALLTYIRQWADRFVASDGSIGNSFNNLDSMLAGRVLLILYKETGQAKYRTAAKKIRDRFATYPKTSDTRYPPIGGFWHSTSASRVGQLWSDGVFMSMPFLAEWGRDSASSPADRDAAWDIATNQLTIYAGHLQQPNGLMKHAYDEPRDESWSDNTTGLAPEYWCRAVGWFGMATIQILDIIPADHPRRGQLVTIVQNLVRGFKTYQDPATGRWFQVVDKGNRSDNWTETSCSAMYTYTVDRAIEKGYVPAAQYQDTADRGFRGVLDKIRLGSDNLTYLDTISEGTNVGNYAYYIGRAQRTNDFHGLGAFIIMFEQLRG